MKKLSRNMLAKRDQVIMCLSSRYGKLEDAIEVFNEAVSIAWEKVDQALESYNGAVEEANNWMEEIASEIENYIEERSKKWQESEQGQSYTSWQEEYQGNDLELIDLDQPEALSLSSDDQTGVLDGLSEEVS